jgi:23S rRNA (uracil1939-C5)-methyltransferase
LVEALRQRGLSGEVAPLRPIPAGSRRRAVFTARREKKGGVLLGYHPRESDVVFALTECPVLVAEIVAALPALREIAAHAAEPEVRLTVLATPAGLDVAVSSERRLAGSAAARLAQIAAGERGLARLALNGETLSQRSLPQLSFAGVEVCPPPGAFVQAVAAAEALLGEEVTNAVRGARRPADLFCGLGTLTFSLARRAPVAAFDSDAEAIAALTAAARHAKGLKPIMASVRDLLREPLAPGELKDYDAVVFDPPRAGAKAQALALARSRVPVVVAVSCAPGTLARDLKILVDGGYHLQGVVPIDQFLFSAHVEAVAHLRR